MRSAMLEALTLDADTRAKAGKQVWTSAQWVDYFHDNALRRLEVPWEAGAGVTEEERAVIVESLRVWQLGEARESGNLRVVAARHAEEEDDPEFMTVVDLFITEELGHGALVGRFLTLAGVEHLRWHYSDTLLKVARHFCRRLESSVTVSAMVEVHALLYHATVRRATGSAVLRQVCTQLVRDEVPHIRFQCERVAILHRKAGPVRRRLTMALHRLLFTGITLGAWLGHRRAYRAGGLTFRKFWKTAWTKMDAAWRAMDPRQYHWPE